MKNPTFALSRLAKKLASRLCKQLGHLGESMRIREIIILLIIVVVAFSLAFASENSLKIRSGISKVYKEAIQVSEDDLRRIYAELEKSCKNLSIPSKVVFHISREDEKYYETTSIEEVLSDPNVIGSKIEYLRLELRIIEPELVRDPWESIWLAKVEFSRTGTNHVGIKISHPDKNWSLLLADNLNSQVKRTFHTKSTPTWLVIALILALYFLGYRLKTSAKKFEVGNFLFSAIYNPMVFGAVATWLFIGWDAISNSEIYITLFGPESGFLWGDAKTAVLHNESIRSNIFWVVVIGFPLAIAANVASTVISKKNLPDASASEGPKNGKP